MASIDERIKAELMEEGEKLDVYLKETTQFPDMVFEAFRGSLRKLMIFAAALAATFFGLLIWSVIEFVNTEETRAAISWALWAILSALGLVLIELFAWMQINRISTRREIKYLEIYVRKALEEK